jgi:hypothetical protein
MDSLAIDSNKKRLKLSATWSSNQYKKKRSPKPSVTLVVPQLNAPDIQVVNDEDGEDEKTLGKLKKANSFDSPVVSELKTPVTHSRRRSGAFSITVDDEPSLLDAQEETLNEFEQLLKDNLPAEIAGQLNVVIQFLKSIGVSEISHLKICFEFRILKYLGVPPELCTGLQKHFEAQANLEPVPKKKHKKSSVSIVVNGSSKGATQILRFPEGVDRLIHLSSLTPDERIIICQTYLGWYISHFILHGFPIIPIDLTYDMFRSYCIDVALIELLCLVNILFFICQPSESRHNPIRFDFRCFLIDAAKDYKVNIPSESKTAANTSKSTTHLQALWMMFSFQMYKMKFTTLSLLVQEEISLAWKNLLNMLDRFQFYYLNAITNPVSGKGALLVSMFPMDFMDLLQAEFSSNGMRNCSQIFM